MKAYVPAWIPSTLSNHISNCRQHPVCAELINGKICWSAKSDVSVRMRTSLMKLSLLHQQRPVHLVRLTWMVCEMGGMWPYFYCLEWFCSQDWFKTLKILLLFCFVLFYLFMRFV